MTGFGVTGRIARLGPGDSLLVSVSTSVMEANVRMRTKEDSLVLLRSDVQQAAIRTLNRKKTAWATTAFSVAAMASVAFALQRGGRAGGGVPNPPPPPDQRYPLGMRVAVP